MARLELDLYRDVGPFDGGFPQEAISFYPLTDRCREPVKSKLPPLMKPTETRLERSEITESFFVVDKKPGELLDATTLLLAKAFKTKHFYVASSGVLDILASGIALLCCGKSMDHIDYFDSLPHTYNGVLKLGQVSSSFDLKKHVHTYHPWKHITGNK